jgi:hypothetical protein
MDEAEANLKEMRVVYIEHLLQHGLAVPEPFWLEINDKSGDFPSAPLFEFPYHKEEADNVEMQFA